MAIVTRKMSMNLPTVTGPKPQFKECHNIFAELLRLPAHTAKINAQSIEELIDYIWRKALDGQLDDFPNLSGNIEIKSFASRYSIWLARQVSITEGRGDPSPLRKDLQKQTTKLEEENSLNPIKNPQDLRKLSIILWCHLIFGVLYPDSLTPGSRNLYPLGELLLHFSNRTHRQLHVQFRNKPNNNVIPSKLPNHNSAGKSVSPDFPATYVKSHGWFCTKLTLYLCMDGSTSAELTIRKN